MAGSYGHITNEQGQFIGCELLDNLGDAYEALEECYGMIWWLATALNRDGASSVIETARLAYEDGLRLSPGKVEQRVTSVEVQW